MLSLSCFSSESPSITSRIARTKTDKNEKDKFIQHIQLSFPNFTNCIKVAEGTLGTAISQGEQSECITLLEDGVVWLVDGDDHYSFVDMAQAVDSKMSEVILIAQFRSG